MSKVRISMRHIREILRLSFCAGLSICQINRSTKTSVGSVHNLLRRAGELGVNWPLIESLDDTELARLFYPRSDPGLSKRLQTPSWPDIYLELKRKGVTKLLLWEEYAEQYPNRCYSYTQYCALYTEWLKKQKRSMRQQHKAGEKLFVDYCGPTIGIVNPDTGEIRQTQIFVAVMGASGYTFAEATWSQTLPDWLGSHSRALSFFGGVPAVIVPGNLKSGVQRACRYDPEINRSYQQFASHYGVAIIPARPYKPKDKAKVEVGVQIVERWILARLRHHTFFSLAELNSCIKTLLQDLNSRAFQKLSGSRQTLLEQTDKPALKALPKRAWQYTDIKMVKVNIDYHVSYQNHNYSVPHQLVGEKLELHAGEYLIHLYYQNRLAATHPRNYTAGTTTQPGHMPTRHHKHQSWTPGRL